MARRRLHPSRDHHDRPALEQNVGVETDRRLRIGGARSSAHVQSTWSASGVGDYYGGFAHVDALDVLKVCLRRWYVVLPVVLLSLAAGLGLALQQKPTYTASGSYALVYYSSATAGKLSPPRLATPEKGIHLPRRERCYSAKRL